MATHYSFALPPAQRSHLAFKLRVIICGLVLVTTCGASTPTLAAPCATGSEIVRSFDNGAGWEFCWRIEPSTGLSLTDIFYRTRSGTRRQLIKTLGIAALDVSALNSGSVVSHVSSNGFGQSQRSLTSIDCPEGSVVNDNSANACLQILQRGYASKYYSDAIQGQALTLSAVSELSTGSYVQRFELADDGTIHTQLGHGGAISSRTTTAQLGWPVSDSNSANEIATAYSINALWRIDMHIGDTADNDAVETIEAIPSADRLTKTIVVTPMTREFAARINATNKRTWRVLDRDTLNSNGQPVSYELAPVESGQILRNTQRIVWTDNDIYVTRHAACESTSPALQSGCSGSLPLYVNGESIDRADVVLWYRTTLYRLPAAEDRGTQRIKFMGFSLSPRDWMAYDGN